MKSASLLVCLAAATIACFILLDAAPPQFPSFQYHYRGPAISIINKSLPTCNKKVDAEGKKPAIRSAAAPDRRLFSYFCVRDFPWSSGWSDRDGLCFGLVLSGLAFVLMGPFTSCDDQQKVW